MTRTRLILAALLLLLLYPSFARGACGGVSPTLTAASASQADVAACVAIVTNGDTINVPCDTQTWTTTLTITNKYFTLSGGGGGCTVITDNTNDNLIFWTTTTGGLSRITGITFEGGSPLVVSFGTKNNQGIIFLIGNSGTFRFDHNAMNTRNSSGLRIHGYVRGVADHNAFTQRFFQTATIIDHESWLDVGNYGDKSWATATALGNAEAFYFEDNTFATALNEMIYANDGQQGSRVVFRYNAYTNTIWANHGTETGGRQRSMRTSETYNNIFNLDARLPIGASQITGTGITTGDTAVSSTTISNLASVSGIVAGQMVIGVGIPSLATVSSIGASSVVISAAATSTVSGGQLGFLNANGAGSFPDIWGSRGGTGVVWGNTLTLTGGTMPGGFEVGYLRESDRSRTYFPWGWAGQTPITSITNIGSGATLTVSGGHGVHASCSVPVPCYVFIAGANQAPYNGRQQAVYVSPTVYTYTMGSDPGANATGTLIQTSPWDANADTNGYRDMDQNGAGVGDLISGDQPLAPSDGLGIHQALEPFYAWSNTKNGVASLLYSNAVDVQIENRDFFNGTVMPGYAAFAYPHPLIPATQSRVGGFPLWGK